MTLLPDLKLPHAPFNVYLTPIICSTIPDKGGLSPNYSKN